MPARHYLISGRVQGVGFRWFTKQAADRLGVRGWVRNLPDGSVEAEAEADTATLAQFEAKLREGPRGGHVDALRISDRDPLASTTFDIR